MKKIKKMDEIDLLGQKDWIRSLHEINDHNALCSAPKEDLEHV